MTPDKDAEIARLRRELEVALESARVNGEERNELAKALGAEVATTQRMKAALRHCVDDHVKTMGPCNADKDGKPVPGCDCCECIARAVLASGNGDGK